MRLVEIDRGRSIGPVHAYRLALGKVGPLLGGLALAAAAWVALTATAVLIPVAIWLGVRWILLAQVVELEARSGGGRPASERRARARPVAPASPRSSGSAPYSRSPPARSSARS